MAFIAHCAEEYPRFPKWATRHFGTTTPEFYLASHAVLVPVVAAVDAHASHGRPGRFKAWSATALASTLVANAAFHATTTVVFREYSPGVVSGLVLLLPIGAADIRADRQRNELSARARATAIAVGAVINAAIVASLLVDMPPLDGGRSDPFDLSAPGAHRSPRREVSG